MRYDCATDRFVGFVLPLNNDSLPVIDAFVIVLFPLQDDTKLKLILNSQQMAVIGKTKYMENISRNMRSN